MARVLRLSVAVLAVLTVALLTPAAAQDKKPGDPRDPDKNTKDKNEKDKIKDEEKKKEPRLRIGQVFNGQLKAVREGTLDIAEVDRKKALVFEQWKYQQQIEILKTPLGQRAQRTAQYQKELERKQHEIFAEKGKEYRTADSMRIRALTPPVEYDDKGFQKKSTAKREKLPDRNVWVYPANFDSLKAGQLVTVYVAKSKKLPPKTRDKKGSKADDEDDVRNRPPILMVVITLEPKE